MTRFLTHLIVLLATFIAGAYAMLLHDRQATSQATCIDDRGAVPVRGSVTLKQAALGQYTLSLEALTSSKSGLEKPRNVRVVLSGDALNVHGTLDSGELLVSDVTGYVVADLEEERP